MTDNETTNSMRLIKVCSNHQDRLTPLLNTMVFEGAEWWCPFCGYMCGLFWPGENVESTPDLEQLREQDLLRSVEYLRAMGRSIAVKTLHEGKWIHPKDLPEHEKEKDRGIISNWTYPVSSHHSESHRRSAKL